VKVIVSLDDSETEVLEVWGLGLGVKASCTRLSLLISLLMNVEFFPFNVTETGICDAVEGVILCLVIWVIVSVKWVSLKLPDSFFGSDVADHIINFGMVVGFVPKRNSPGAPSVNGG
jgi:hypothetical protein